MEQKASGPEDAPGTTKRVKTEAKQKPVLSAKNPAVKLLTVQSPQLFGALDKVVKTEALKDVELVLNGKDKLRVHRLVLAALSEPLCRKFEGDAGNSLKLNNISDVDAFKLLLDYMYGKELKVAQDKVVPLLTVACLWKVEGLKKSCEDFLVKNISCENAVEALGVSERLDLPQVGAVASEFVSKNFPSFQKDFFQRLPDSLFERIFSRADLNVPGSSGELEIINLIFMRAAGEPERVNRLLQSCVRFVDLGDEQLVDLSLNERFQTVDRKAMILDALIKKKLSTCAASNKQFAAKTKRAVHLQSRLGSKGITRKLLWPFF